MKQYTTKTLLYFMALPALFLAGWSANHTFSVWMSPHRLYMSDPAISDYPSEVIYNPKTFKDDITRFVENYDYPDAIALLDAAYIDQQIVADGGEQYYAVGGYAVDLPGTNFNYDPQRDWFMPKTGCCIDSFIWSARAESFAKAYNRRVNANLNGG